MGLIPLKSPSGFHITSRDHRDHVCSVASLLCWDHLLPTALQLFAQSPQTWALFGFKLEGRMMLALVSAVSPSRGSTELGLVVTRFLQGLTLQTHAALKAFSLSTCYFVCICHCVLERSSHFLIPSVRMKVPYKQRPMKSVIWVLQVTGQEDWLMATLCVDSVLSSYQEVSRVSSSIESLMVLS